MTSRRGPGIPESSSLLLNRLAEKFTPLDDGKGDFDEQVGVGDLINNFASVIPTVFIVSSEAPVWIQNAAEIALESGNINGWYLCSGEDDHEEIIAASGDSKFNSRLLFSTGTFFVDPSQLDIPAGQHWQGLGMLQTYFRNQTTGDLTSYLVHPQTDSELSNIGFNTTFDYLGYAVLNDYGTLHSIWHQGAASVGIWVNGAQHPISDIMVGGNYTDAGIVIDEGWVTMNNVVSLRSSTAAGGAFMRITFHATAPTTLNNIIVSYFTNVGHGIVLEECGKVSISNFSISVPGRAGFYIDGNTPFHGVIGPGVIDDCAYGIQSLSGGGMNDMLWHDIFINPSVTGLDINGATRCKFRGIIVDSPGEHGVRVASGSGNTFDDITIYQPGLDTDNLYDGLLVNSGGNYFRNFTIIPKASANQPRYGIHIQSGDDNIVVGNDLWFASQYGTAPIKDLGLRTVWTYPNHPIYGDNFVRGASSGSGSIVEGIVDDVGVRDSVSISMNDGQLEVVDGVGVTDEVTTASGVPLIETITEPIGITSSVIAAEEIKSVADGVGITDSVLPVLNP